MFAYTTIKRIVTPRKVNLVFTSLKTANDAKIPLFQRFCALDFLVFSYSILLGTKESKAPQNLYNTVIEP